MKGFSHTCGFIICIAPCILGKIKERILKGKRTMRILYLIVGIILLSLFLIDLIWTSLWIDGRIGPVSGPMSRNIWKFVRDISNSNSFWMSLSAPFILIVTLLTWIALMWLGWTFIFSLDPTSISDTINGGSIAWYERFYYVGYSIFTLGNGNYAPKEGFWQIMTTFVSGFGMMFLTFGVSYILNIINAVVEKRSFATDLTSIAESSEDLLEMGWNGKDFSRLNAYFMTISESLSSLTQKHKAYPLLFYYHSTNPDEAIVNSLSIIDDTITLFEYGMSRDVEINAIFLQGIYASITTYIEYAEEVYNISEHEEPLDLPDFDRLHELGMPVVDAETYKENIKHLDRRRHLLAGLMDANGRKHEASAK